MTGWAKFRGLGDKLRGRFATRGSESTNANCSSPEEERQLDLLLEEIRNNEQQLGPDHWTSLAAAFRQRVDEEGLGREPDGGRRARLARYKSFASGAVPLGGLLAVAALMLGQSSGSTAPSAETASYVAVTSIPPEVSPLAATAAGPSSASRPAATATSVTVDTENPREIAPHQRKKPSLPSLPPPSTFDATHEVATPTPPPAAPLTASTTPSAAVATPVDTFAEQLTALKRADRALKSGNSLDARAALKREFSPQLALHASALRVILACQDGSAALGRRALSAQEAKFPNSPYLQRMRRACGVGRDD